MDPFSVLKELDIAFLLSDMEEINWYVFHVCLPAILSRKIDMIIGHLKLFVKSKIFRFVIQMPPLRGLITGCKRFST